MAKKKTAKKSMSAEQKVGIGVGLTAAAVAAAGTYFLWGSPNAAKNRQKVKGWSLKAKGEVLEALEKAQEMTEKEYNELIDKVGKTYATVQGATRGDIADFKRDMKAQWTKIVKQAGGTKKTAKKNTKKTAKTAKKAKTTTKKTAKKVAKKTAKKTSSKKS